VSRPQKRRQERLHPGLKLQTPIEKKITALTKTSDRNRWTALMAQPLNKWKPVV
jgi:hypothetical protein